MGGGGKGGGQTVAGHRYYFTIHMGLCRGPIDELMAIKIGERMAWPLQQAPGTAAIGEVNLASAGVSTTVTVTSGGSSYSNVVGINWGASISATLGDKQQVEITGFQATLNVRNAAGIIIGTQAINLDGTYSIHSIAGTTLNIVVPNLPTGYETGANGGTVATYAPNDVRNWAKYALGEKAVYPGTINYRSFLVNAVDGEARDVGYPATTTKSIYINAPNLFGGDEAEGGIQGWLQLMMGEPNQGTNPTLVGLHQDSRPGTFRGVVTAIYDGLIATFSPYPKPWAFRVKRIVKGWDGDVFEPELAAVPVGYATGTAPNPTPVTKYPFSGNNTPSPAAASATASISKPSGIWTYAGSALQMDTTTGQPNDDRVVVTPSAPTASGYYQFAENSGTIRAYVDVTTLRFNAISYSVSQFTPMKVAAVFGKINAGLNSNFTMTAWCQLEYASGWKVALYTSTPEGGTVRHGDTPYPGLTSASDFFYKFFGNPVFAATALSQAHRYGIAFNNSLSRVELQVDSATKVTAAYPTNGKYLSYITSATVQLDLRSAFNHNGNIVRIRNFVIDYMMGASMLYGMNPAHILYELGTNRYWGRKLPRSLFDDASFAAAANTLYSEGFGLSFAWARTDDVGQFAQSVIDHVGAVVFPSRQTGKITMRLIRSDYDINDLPLYTFDNGVLSIEEDEEASPDSTYNEIILKYTNPVDGNPRSIRVQNLSGLLSRDGIVSKTVDYPGVMSASLAARLAQRDLRANGLPLRRMKLKFDRRGWAIEPGSAFRVQFASRGIDAMVMRAGLVVDAATDGSTVTITCVQDIFGVPLTSYVVEQPEPEQESRDPQEALYGRIVEASYRDLVLKLDGATLDALADTSSYVSVVGVRQQMYAMDYDTRTSTSASTLKSIATGQWPGWGEVVEVDRNASTVQFSMFGDLNRVVIGGLAMINDEVVRIDTLDAENGIVGVSRGCLDTVPTRHESGSIMYFLDNAGGDDPTEYVSGQTVYAKILTRTSVGLLHPSLAPLLSTTIVARHAKPYPPANVMVNSVVHDESVPLELDLTFSWVNRNRDTQADVVVPFNAANITPPVGLTYRVRVYGADGTTLKRTVTGITGTSWQYTLVMWTEDGSPDSITVKIDSYLGTLYSWQAYTVKVLISAGRGWGRDWGEAWGGSILSASTYNTRALIRGDGIEGGTDIFDDVGHDVIKTGAVVTTTAGTPFGTGQLALPLGASITLIGDTANAVNADDFILYRNFQLEAKAHLLDYGLEFIIAQAVDGTSTHQWVFRVNPDGSLYFGLAAPTSATQYVTSLDGAVPQGQDTHLAVADDGTTIRLFVDGVVVGSRASIAVGTGATKPTRMRVGHSSGGAPGSIARSWLLEELRLKRGSVDYTGTFTPPTGPHPNL